jgi:hypothetical protein
MIDVKDFDKIKYACYPEGERKPITDLIGLDTEAYSTGEPFLCMLSTGAEISLHEVPQWFFGELPKEVLKKPQLKSLVKKSKYLNRHFCTYNLKYDSGALLYFLSNEDKFTLWKYGSVCIKTDNEKYYIEYIPHKLLSFYHRKTSIKIWDVAQYFNMSLAEASRVYLKKEGKLDIETKVFSRRYVEENLPRIRKYCLKDAETCAELGKHLIIKLNEFGISVLALYSAASLSYEYFSSCCNIVTVKRLWDYYRDVLRYAVEAYRGGKFECTARGSFSQGWQYDIVSAYPYEIRNLLNIDRARVAFSKDYVKDSVYGFLRVRIVQNDPSIYIPCALKNAQGVDVYPCGEFYTTIIKQEYDYLVELGVDVEIISAYWLIIERESYPYRETIEELFRIKAQYKGKDAFLYEVSKKMMNSFYGKTLQMIAETVVDTENVVSNKNENVVYGEKTIYRAGRAFNPVYGAVITANTRIKVTRLQNLLKEDCCAVHTDSVLSLRELPSEMQTGELGAFELQKTGNGIIVACGQYQVHDKGAYKGFKPAADEDWFTLLRKNRMKRSFTQKTLYVEGWYEATAKGHYDRINYFYEGKKVIDLNADTKRLWLRKVRAQDLLDGLEQSLPQVIIQKEKPEQWH